MTKQAVSGGPDVSWHAKPYYSLDAWCKNTYGEKLYKIALNAGMTCPNRDGTLDTRGCIFCSAGGSGDFAVPTAPSPAAGPGIVSSLSAQLAAGRALLHNKPSGQRYIAYFQAYTNTYAPVSYLEQIYTQALREEQVVGISIATRPDCLGSEVLSLLHRLKLAWPGKFIWIELGLQTIHEATALYIRRGYPLCVFHDAVFALQALDIPVIVHVILGLPGETPARMVETVCSLNALPVWGVKLQLLHVLSGTDLALDYRRHYFETLTQEDYLAILAECLARLSPDRVIHRLTGDGPRALLLAPLWSLNKRQVLNNLHKYMKEKNYWQGVYYHDAGTADFI